MNVRARRREDDEDDGGDDCDDDDDGERACVNPPWRGVRRTLTARLCEPPMGGRLTLSPPGPTRGVGGLAPPPSLIRLVYSDPREGRAEMCDARQRNGVTTRMQGRGERGHALYPTHTPSLNPCGEPADPLAPAPLTSPRLGAARNKNKP